MPTATVQWKYYKAVNSLKISLGNLALFIITFIFLIVRKENLKSIDNKSEKKEQNSNLGSSENKKQDSEHIVNIESTIRDDKSESTNDKSQESYDSNYNEVFDVPTANNTTAVSEKLQSIDVIQQVAIGFSGTFLIISIIFAIFFCKHQQKRNKKTSK